MPVHVCVCVYRVVVRVGWRGEVEATRILPESFY